MTVLALAACAEGSTEPPANPVPSVTPNAPSAPAAPTVGTLRIVVSGLQAGAASGGEVFVRPCTATSCPAIPRWTMQRHSLSASGTTEIAIAPGSYAVQFDVPAGYEWAGAETGWEMGAWVEAGGETAVRFNVAPTR